MVLFSTSVLKEVTEDGTLPETETDEWPLSLHIQGPLFGFVVSVVTHTEDDPPKLRSQRTD